MVNKNMTVLTNDDFARLRQFKRDMGQIASMLDSYVSDDADNLRRELEKTREKVQSFLSSHA